MRGLLEPTSEHEMAVAGWPILQLGDPLEAAFLIQSGRLKLV
jgi:hypothetical protein